MKMLKINELYNNLESNGDCLTDYNSGYICDIISEIADSQVDIYDSDLREWANGHFEKIANAISEFGWDGCGKDLYKAVQMAQYMENEEEIYSELSESLENFALSYMEHDLKMQEISEENWEEIQNFLFEIDSNDHLDEITDFIDELFQSEKQ